MKYISFLILITFTSCGPVRMLAASFSKEYCSCIFVENGDDQSCKKYVSFLVPPTSYEVNRNSRTVKANFFGFTSKSTFTGMRFGCVLN